MSCSYTCAYDTSFKMSQIRADVYSAKDFPSKRKWRKVLPPDYCLRRQTLIGEQSGNEFARCLIWLLPYLEESFPLGEDVGWKLENHRKFSYSLIELKSFEGFWVKETMLIELN